MIRLYWLGPSAADGQRLWVLDAGPGSPIWRIVAVQDFRGHTFFNLQAKERPRGWFTLDPMEKARVWAAEFPNGESFLLTEAGITQCIETYGREIPGVGGL